MSFKSGQLIELKFSDHYHRKNLPLLISPLVLRSLGCGQVDLSFLNQKGEVELWELKRGQSLPYKQYIRLKSSQEFISKLLNLPVRLCLSLENAVLPKS